MKRSLLPLFNLMRVGEEVRVVVVADTNDAFYCRLWGCASMRINQGDAIDL